MKIYLQNSLKWILAIAVFQNVSVVDAAVRTDTENNRLLGKTLIADSGQFDGNRIRNDLENNGMLVSHRITGHSGMEWPKGSHKYINFASGIWIAGKVGGDIRTAVGEYGPEFVAGPWGSEAGDAEHQLYIVNKSDLADPLASSDFQNWPAHLGAPWVDVDEDGVYSPMPTGPDHPEFIGDQVIWWVMNDGEIAEHSIFSTLPLGVEVQMTLWGYDRPDAFGDMMFVKALIINKGGVDVDDTIIGLWADPDLGYAGDDFVGCDIDLSLGFCYNDGADADYGSDPPAIGYDFFQGPLVPCEEADIADSTNTDCYPGSLGGLAYGTRHPGMKNLPMSSFTKYINGDPVYTDPNDAIEAYYYMSGFLKDGSPFINSETGEASMFVHADDPNDNTGSGDGVWVDSDDHASGDRRFLMNAGPFTLADGDSQEVVFGMLIARGSDALSSVTALKEADKLAQLAYDIQFALPESPTAPNVEITSYADYVLLNWDDGENLVESYVAVDVIDKLPVPVSFDTTYATGWFESSTDLSDPIVLDSLFQTDDSTYIYNVQYVENVDTAFAGQNTEFTFQGYNIYQVETASGQGAVKRIATYDLVDGITEIFDDVFDPSFGETINRRVQFGSDSGIKRSIMIDQDALNAGIPLKTNRVYYYAVTAYGYNQYGIPRTLESPMNIFTIRPQSSTVHDEPETIPYNTSIMADHSLGQSDGFATAYVVDPLSVTGDSYQITFHFNADSTALVWDLVNTTSGLELVSDNSIQSGADMETGVLVGTNANPIIDGVQIHVTGAPDDFKDIYVTANGSGELDPVAEGTADWMGWPNTGLSDVYGRSNQANGTFWMFAAGGMADYTYDSFLARAVVGRSNKWTYLVPNDFEYRFTYDDDNYIYMAYSTGSLVKVPFEIWDVTNNVRLVCWSYDESGDDNWGLFAKDHPLSGADNDPYTDWVYPRRPSDMTPGESGYQAWLAASIAAGGGDPDGDGNYKDGGDYYAEDYGPEVMGRNCFVVWNLDDVSDGTLDLEDPSLGQVEQGTVFRINTTKPNTVDDVFTFSTGSLLTASATYSPDEIKVWPNPYFGFNPEERTSLERKVTFTHLPEGDGTATIRIFNLSGQLVKKLDHNDGTQYEVWDLTNNFSVPVTSGMYIAHISTSKGDKVLKIAIVQPEERIDVY